MDKPSFFAELQCRHVYKIGARYCRARVAVQRLKTGS
jgi:hypothetical protein